jgi:hypothetical protein
MAIEDLKTKQDLERFIGEVVEQLPMNSINGLPNALALTLKAEIDDVAVSIPEGARESAPVKVPHGLGMVPRFIGFTIVDESGENTYGFRILERTKTDFTFVLNAAEAAPAGGLTRNVEYAAMRGGEP